MCYVLIEKTCWLCICFSHSVNSPSANAKNEHFRGLIAREALCSLCAVKSTTKMVLMKFAESKMYVKSVSGFVKSASYTLQITSIEHDVFCVHFYYFFFNIEQCHCIFYCSCGMHAFHFALELSLVLWLLLLLLICATTIVAINKERHLFRFPVSLRSLIN